jgi:type IX secretion system PorP/SprF family membrane protein
MKTFFTSVLFFLLITIGFSQQEPQSSLYVNNPMLYNPAFAGTFPHTAIQAGCRFQWIGIKGAPMTQYASFNTGFKKKSFGIGAHFINGIIGARLTQSAYVNFGYNVKLNRKGHRLALGISGGIDIEQLQFSNLYVNPDDVNDPLRINEVIYNPNFGAGAYYYGENFFAGFSIPRILQNQLAVYDSAALDRHNFRNQHMYVMGGYNFKITNTISMRTSAMVRLVVNAPVSFDISTSVVFYDKFLVGVNYRFNESIGINANFKIGKKWTIGYAYDLPTNALAFQQWGSHEIMFGLNLGTSRKKSPVGCFYF